MILRFAPIIAGLLRRVAARNDDHPAAARNKKTPCQRAWKTFTINSE